MNVEEICIMTRIYDPAKITLFTSRKHLRNIRSIRWLQLNIVEWWHFFNLSILQKYDKAPLFIGINQGIFRDNMRNLLSFDIDSRLGSNCVEHFLNAGDT